MTIATVPGWTPKTDLDAVIRRWQHDEYDVWMTVSHQPDHYEESEQVMRWHARVTLGRNITVGINEIFHCDDMPCETAESNAMEWAQNWMNGEDSDDFLTSLNDEWRRSSDE